MDPETDEPDWIVTNPDGEQYIVPDKTFRKKYEVEVDAEGYHYLATLCIPDGASCYNVELTIDRDDQLSFSSADVE